MSDDPDKYFDSTDLTRMRTILDLTCERLSIDTGTLDTLPTRQFIGRQLMQMHDWHKKPDDLLISQLTELARGSSASR